MATTERSTIVRLQAEISGFKRGMTEASKAAAETASSASKNFGSTNSALGTLIQTSQRYPESWNQIAGASLKAGLAVTAGIGLTVKAAMDWESAWTGVKKTVDGTPEQLASVEAGLRNLSKTLPTSNIQIAAVAEAAGQLGVKTGDVVAFTKTMIDMGESTNLSAEEAATAIARFTNVMGTVDRLGASAYNKVGAAIVGLGNNFATTEREILEMAQRLSSAGRSANFTEGDILGLSAAMSSVGIDAEAGGTAMTMVMNKIGRAVDTGSDKLSSFARVAGMSSDDFSKKWKTAPAQALQAVVEGLGKAQSSGKSMVQMLDELGIKGVREANSMRSLANASGILGDAIAQGNREFASGSALIEEAGKRYETTESKVRIAWNSIKDSSIDVGAALLPVVAGISQGISGMAEAFGSLPDTVKGSIGVLGAFAGIGLLAVGGGMKLISSIVETRAALSTLGVSGTKAAGVIGTVGKAAGVAAAALVGLQLIGNLIPDKATASAGEFAAAIKNVSRESSGGVANLDQLLTRFDGLGKANADANGGINSSARAIQWLAEEAKLGGSAVSDFFSGLVGSSSVATQIKGNLKELGVAMAGLVQGGSADQAAAAFKNLTKEFEANGMGAKDALDALPGYKDALLEVANAAGVANLSQSELEQLASGVMPDSMKKAAVAADGTSTALEGMGGAAIEAAGAISKEMAKALEGLGITAQGTIAIMSTFIDQLVSAGLMVLSERDAMRKYRDSIEAVSTSIQKNGTTMDINTASGRANQAALDAVASSGISVMQSMAKATDAYGSNIYSQEQLQGQLRTNFDQLVKTAGQFGITGGAAQDLARKVLGIPANANIDTWMSDYAKRMAEQTTGSINSVPKNVTITTKFVSLFEERGVPYSDDYDASGRRRDIASFGKVPGRANGGAIGFMAGGGGVYGPGTGTSDTAGLYALSNGEHVLTASDVRALGGQRAVYDLRRGLQSKTVPAATSGARGSAMSESLMRDFIGAVRDRPPVTVKGAPGMSIDQLAEAVAYRIGVSV